MTEPRPQPIIILDARALFGRTNELLWPPFSSLLNAAYKKFVPDAEGHEFPVETLKRLVWDDFHSMETFVHAALRIAGEDAVASGAAIPDSVAIEEQVFFDWMMDAAEWMARRVSEHGRSFLENIEDYQVQATQAGHYINRCVVVMPLPLYQQLLQAVAPDLDFVLMSIPEEHYALADTVSFGPDVTEVQLITTDPEFLGGDRLKAVRADDSEIPVTRHIIDQTDEHDIRASEEALADLMIPLPQWVYQARSSLIGPGTSWLAAKQAFMERKAAENPDESSIVEFVPAETVQPEEKPASPHIFLLHVEPKLSEEQAGLALQESLRRAFESAFAAIVPDRHQAAVTAAIEQAHPADAFLKQIQNYDGTMPDPERIYAAAAYFYDDLFPEEAALRNKSEGDTPLKDILSQQFWHDKIEEMVKDGTQVSGKELYDLYWRAYWELGKLGDPREYIGAIEARAAADPQNPTRAGEFLRDIKTALINFQNSKKGYADVELATALVFDLEQAAGFRFYRDPETASDWWAEISGAYWGSLKTTMTGTLDREFLAFCQRLPDFVRALEHHGTEAQFVMVSMSPAQEMLALSLVHNHIHGSAVFVADDPFTQPHLICDADFRDRFGSDREIHFHTISNTSGFLPTSDFNAAATRCVISDHEHIVREMKTSFDIVKGNADVITDYLADIVGLRDSPPQPPRSPLHQHPGNG